MNQSPIKHVRLLFRGTKKWWPSVLTVAVLVGVGILAATTFRDYGIGWDGRVQDVYGQKLLAYYLSGFRDRSAFTYSDLRFYGGFFDLLATIVNRVSPFGEFETRHLLGAIIFMVGLIGAWRLTRLLAGSQAAAIAVVCLAATPLLYGHAFINPKDSPFAWFLVWVTYFACRIIEQKQRTPLTVYLGFAIFLGLALGTKVFAAAYVGYLLAFLAIAAAVQWSEGKRTEALAGIRSASNVLLYGLPIACAVMVLFWPWAIQAPDNFVSSVEKFLRFPHQVPVLWEGETFSSTKPPANYLLVMLGLKLPEFVLLGLALAAAYAVHNMWRTGPRVFTHVRSQMFFYVAITAVVPIAAFTVLRPTVYNGMRQYLFVVPPLVILGAIGLYFAIMQATRWRHDAAVLLGGLLALAVVREAIVMRNLHPYEYVAFNAIDGNLAHIGHEFELDYWGTSLAEASRDLPKVLTKNEGLTAQPSHTSQVFVCGDRLSAEYFMPHSLQVTDKLDSADFLMAPDAAVCQSLLRRSARILLEIRREGAVLSRVLDLRQHTAVSGNSLK